MYCSRQRLTLHINTKFIGGMGCTNHVLKSCYYTLYFAHKVKGLQLTRLDNEGCHFASSSRHHLVVKVGLIQYIDRVPGLFSSVDLYLLTVMPNDGKIMYWHGMQPSIAWFFD